MLSILLTIVADIISPSKTVYHPVIFSTCMLPTPFSYSVYSKKSYEVLSTLVFTSLSAIR